MKKILYLLSLTFILSQAISPDARVITLSINEQKQSITIIRRITTSYFCHIIADLVARDTPGKKIQSISAEFLYVDNCPERESSGNFISDLTGQLVTNYIPKDIDESLHHLKGDLLGLKSNAILCCDTVEVILK